MIIIDDIRSLKRQLSAVDIHDHIAFNELAYHDRNETHIFMYCPFCGRAIKLKADFVMEETPERIKLKRPISCGCRRGLRYVNKDFERRFLTRIPAKDTKWLWKAFLGIALVLLLPMRLCQMQYEPGSSDEIGAGVFIATALPFFFGLLSLIAYFAHPEKKYKKMRDPDKQRETVIKGMAKANRLNPAFAEKRKQMLQKARQTRRGSSYGAAGAGVAATGAAWIPDDFEPGLDPYEREALYTAQMVDDWVIARGGNPYDIGDVSDAFSDPFGFHDDFGGGDGGFGGFGDGWGGGGFGGFGGGDD